jgi:hypothetical protein
MTEITPKYQVQYSIEDGDNILAFIGDAEARFETRCTMDENGNPAYHRILVVETREGEKDCNYGGWIIVCENGDVYVREQKQ